MKGKRQRFEALIEEYSPKLYAQIRSMVLNHADADDVLQNTLMKAWMKLDDFREKSALTTWLFRIAVNEALIHLRSRQKQQHLYVDQEVEQVSEADRMMVADPAGLLEQALAHLTEKQRLIFGLRYYNEFTYSQMSEITRLSEGTLKATYYQVTRKIEKYVRQYE